MEPGLALKAAIYNGAYYKAINVCECLSLNAMYGFNACLCHDRCMRSVEMSLCVSYRHGPRSSINIEVSQASPSHKCLLVSFHSHCYSFPYLQLCCLCIRAQMHRAYRMACFLCLNVFCIVSRLCL